MVFLIWIIVLSQSLLIPFGLGLLYLADCLLNLWLLTPFVFIDCAHRSSEKGGSLGGTQTVVVGQTIFPVQYLTSGVSFYGLSLLESYLSLACEKTKDFISIQLFLSPL
jgi:hypothetical protein